MPGFMLFMAWFELSAVGGKLVTGNLDIGALLILGLSAAFKMMSERDYRNQK